LIELSSPLSLVDKASLPADPLATMRSLLICNVSTLLVFGLLALSDVPVLHSIGLTVTLGGLGALIFSFMMVHDNANCTEGSA
jgi:predicted exporter